MARLLAGELMSCGWILTLGKRFFSEAFNPASYSVGSWSHCAEDKVAGNLKLSTHPYLLLRLRMSGDVPSLPCLSPWRVFGQLYKIYVGSLNCFKIVCLLHISSHLLYIVTKSSIVFICCTLHSISFLQNSVFLFYFPVSPWVVISCKGKTQLWCHVFVDVGLFHGVSGTWYFRYNAFQIFVITHPVTQCHIPEYLNL